MRSLPDPLALIQSELDSLRAEVGQADRLVHEAIKDLASSFVGMQAQIAAQDRVLQELMSRVRRLSEGDPHSGAHKGLEELSGAMAHMLQEFVSHILRTSTDSMDVMHGLGDMAGRMKQVESEVGTVSQLASQTRLLALNASIEASHAGDLGRGFAVVASEVKHLSQGSAACSNRIEQSVEGARTTLERLNAVTERMASADMNFAMERKGKLDAMLAEMAVVNEAVAAGIRDASALTVTVGKDVGVAINALRFEAKVSELLKQVGGRLAAIKPLMLGLTAGQAPLSEMQPLPVPDLDSSSRHPIHGQPKHAH